MEGMLMPNNTTRAARCEYRCQFAEDVSMTGHSCAQECLYRDAAGGSPGAETPPLDDYAKQDFNERLASIKRCIPHMADVGGIWPRDVEWLIGQLASQSATIATLQQHLADAVVTARYQSDVARQADDAREKAVEARANIAVVLFRRHQRLSAAVGMDPGYSADGTIDKAIERLASLQAENARLRADAARLSRLEELGDFWVVEPRLSEDAWEIRVGNETIGYGADLRDAIDGATPTPPQERKARLRDYTNAVTHSSYCFWLSREHAERLAAEQAVSGTESWNEWKPVPNTEAAYFALKQRVIDEQDATRAASAQDRP
jgi:hypothetical protein